MTLLYSMGTLTVPISLLNSLLAHWQSLYHPTSLFWRNSSPYVTLFYHLAQWQSLYYSTTLYLPTDRLHITLLYSIGTLTVPLSLYWPTGSPYITLQYSTDPLTFPKSINNSLLAHWQSLYHSTILNEPTDKSYTNQKLSWPTGSPYITLL